MIDLILKAIKTLYQALCIALLVTLANSGLPDFRVFLASLILAIAYIVVTDAEI